MQKILLIGSGGLHIGQAGEFDYSGSQAMKALKEEGIAVVLVNPNIATVQTDPNSVDALYLIPITADDVESVIAKERPDGVLLGFGGQTALNVGIELFDKGVFERYGVAVLGTPIDAICNSEDKGIFSSILSEIGVVAPKSISVRTLSEALEAAEHIGFPCMLRTGFALGGLASGIVGSHEELVHRARQALSASPTLLIEENLTGWKEIEYEIMRDMNDNAIAVCNMENVDPVGIHTGDSIVVAPSQTLSNLEYHAFRSRSIEIARHFGVIGECNIQYALHPTSGEYRVIEMNARLSRSSALASKATGYPIAFIAAKLALGKSLPELKNPVTGVTSAFFEPALDYCTVKMPRWDTQKFRGATEGIGPEMKSVGEVMAIGRNFCEALQKAVRMAHGISGDLALAPERPVDILSLSKPTERRLWDLYSCFKRGESLDVIVKTTSIHRWFLWHIKRIADEDSAQPSLRSSDDFLRVKRLGFSDAAIAKWLNISPLEARARRIAHGVVPVIRQIDTLAGEYPAVTNYLYCTYDGDSHDIQPSREALCILGGGAYSVGSSVEFDWCAVSMARMLRSHGKQTILINCNPETVSTDYNESDRLYFEELTEERVRDILDFETPIYCIVSVGGQVSNALALPLARANYPIMGTSAQSIDSAENRAAFSSLLDHLGIRQPQWIAAASRPEVYQFCRTVGYPVLVRPSYVLSGSCMSIAAQREELDASLDAAHSISSEHPVLVSKFIEGAIEFEIDGVSSEGVCVVSVISEHIEPAGVHSGDATIVYPPFRLSEIKQREAEGICMKISKALAITGPWNIQCLLLKDELFIIECNLRASRSFPFISKASGIDLIKHSALALLGSTSERAASPNHGILYCVKSPQFSFRRLKGADPLPRIEMASTGEVACFGTTVHSALLRAWRASGNPTSQGAIIIIADSDISVAPLGPCIDRIAEHADRDRISVFFDNCSQTTHARIVPKPLKKHLSFLLDSIANQRVGLVIVLEQAKQDPPLFYRIRRYAVDYGVPLITDQIIARMILEALLEERGADDHAVQTYQEYREVFAASL